MQKILYRILAILAIGLVAAGCQGFLEDYNYAPIGTNSSSGAFSSI